MQTFITYRSFVDTAKSLDSKRLGKQRLEAIQILNCLKWYNDKSISAPPAYRHHPGILQWVGYDIALKHYLKAMIDEWVNRGYKNTIECDIDNNEPIVYPWWMEDKTQFEAFINTHRNRLMQKDLDYYAEDKTLAWKHNPSLSINSKVNLFNTYYDPNLDYYWPVRLDKKTKRIAMWNPDNTIIRNIIL